MSSNAPDSGAPRSELDAANPPVPAPGVISGVLSIIAGGAGFGIPIVGMIGSLIGIWLGIMAIRRGRSSRYSPATICGVIGLTLSVLSIAYWVSAVLFESYH